MTPADDIFKPGAMIGPYEILRELGRGGMGRVLLGRDAAVGDRLVAIKVILAHGTPDAEDVSARFMHEIRNLARLDHRNIVTIFTAGNYLGHPYFVMKYIPGLDLLRYLGQWPALDEPARIQKVVEVMARVARAIHHAHLNGIVHRDLKPANILVAEHTAEPIVLDFGIAKYISDTSLTHASRSPGTPAFQAPEQIDVRRKVRDDLIDVWALGVVTYRALTGRQPFASGDFLALCMEILDHNPVSPRALVPAIPAPLEQIVLACLEKDPKRRPASALAVAELLEAAIAEGPHDDVPAAADEPPSAAPPPQPSAVTGAGSNSVTTWTSSRRLVVGALAMVMGVVVGWLVIGRLRPARVALTRPIAGVDTVADVVPPAGAAPAEAEPPARPAIDPVLDVRGLVPTPVGVNSTESRSRASTVCSEGAASFYAADVAGSLPLHFIAIHEAGPSSGIRGRSRHGEIDLLIEKLDPMVVALSAWETTQWKVTLAPGASVQRIVLLGSRDQQVSGAGEIPVEWVNGPDDPGYAWPAPSALAATRAAEAATASRLATFRGCYRAESFTIRKDERFEPAASPGRSVATTCRNVLASPAACVGLRGMGDEPEIVLLDLESGRICSSGVTVRESAAASVGLGWEGSKLYYCAGSSSTGESVVELDMTTGALDVARESCSAVITDEHGTLYVVSDMGKQTISSYASFADLKLGHQLDSRSVQGVTASRFAVRNGQWYGAYHSTDRIVRFAWSRPTGTEEIRLVGFNDWVMGLDVLDPDTLVIASREDVSIVDAQSGEFVRSFPVTELAGLKCRVTDGFKPAAVRAAK